MYIKKKKKKERENAFVYGNRVVCHNSHFLQFDIQILVSTRESKKEKTDTHTHTKCIRTTWNKKRGAQLVSETTERIAFLHKREYKCKARNKGQQTNKTYSYQNRRKLLAPSINLVEGRKVEAEEERQQQQQQQQQPKKDTRKQLERQQ